MSEELLKIDKLPTISEFSFLLLGVLDGDTPVQQYDIDVICKNSSFNFALSFENAIKFLSILSLIKINEDNTIHRSFDGFSFENPLSDYALCIFITQRLIDYLSNNNLLEKVFNTKIVSYDVHKDTFSIHTNAMPLDCPMIKQYLIGMGIASPVYNSKGRILINNIYKFFFQKEVLVKVVGSTEGTAIGPIELENKLTPNMKNISLFISYSHKDEGIKSELVNHLSGMKRMGLISEWNDRKILPGEEWDTIIKNKIEQADVILFLISSDFMASDYINDVEIKKAIDRYQQKSVKIVPIIVRPCDFESFPVSQYQALPKDAKAISLWDDKDEALLDVVKSLKKLLQQL